MPSRNASAADQLTTAFAVVGGLLWWVFGPAGPDQAHTPWLIVVLFLGFFAAEWWPLSMEMRGNAVHSTLSGLVVILGSVFVGPAATLVARVPSGALAVRYRWGGTGEKIRFNAVVQIVEVWTVASVFGLVAGGSSLLEGRSGVAIVLALTVAEIVTAAMVLLVIRVSAGPLRGEQLRPMLVAALAAAMVTVTTAVVAVRLMAMDIGTAVAFGMVLVVLVVNNRSRHALSQKHRSVTALYSFMDHVQGRAAAGDQLSALLTEAADVTGAVDVSIILAVENSAHQLRVSDAGLIDEIIDRDTALKIIAAAENGLVVAAGDPRPQPAITGPPGEQLVLAAFSSGSAEGALLLDGRHITKARFDADDVALATALARHAGVAMAQSRLLDQLRARTRELEQSALHDPQTGLLNTDGLISVVPTVEGGTVMVAELVDLDMIDTAFGHGVSVDVAVATAERLGAFAEEHGFTAARIAPGRFACVMPGLDHRLDARDLIGQLRHTLRGPMGRTNLHLEARVAFAAVAAPEHGTDTSDLLRRAKNALVGEERDAGAEIAWFTSDLDSAATDRLELASDLRRAIDEDGLSVAYQPKVDLATGQITGVEALARWAHPTRGYVSPAVFIDVAERTGLIRPLTLWVVNTAIQQAAEWERAGHGISVAVNLSTVVMQDESLARHIIDSCDANGVPGHRLTLEITESQMMGDLERGSGILALFDAAGMKLSVDDFGTGYSSLAQLKALPVDEVKIDRGFITNLSTDADDRAITDAIIRMARSLRLQVVAEGIEDQAALDLLRRMGCDLAQGYHLHRPMPAADVDLLLDAHSTKPVGERDARVVALRPLSG